MTGGGGGGILIVGIAGAAEAGATGSTPLRAAQPRAAADRMPAITRNGRRLQRPDNGGT